MTRVVVRRTKARSGRRVYRLENQFVRRKTTKSTQILKPAIACKKFSLTPVSPAGENVKN